jgi:hypothetical protein
VSDLRAEILSWLETQENLCAAATLGPWAFSPQRGKPGHCFQAQVWRPDGESLADMDATPTEGEASANAALFAASRTVLPLALSALRSVVEEHREDQSGCLADACCATATGPGECPEILRIHKALGLS